MVFEGVGGAVGAAFGAAFAAAIAPDFHGKAAALAACAFDVAI